LEALPELGSPIADRIGFTIEAQRLDSMGTVFLRF
jgi:hypothetical protein